MRTVLLSPWKGGTPRKLCKALGMFSRDLKQWETDPNKSKVGTIVNWGCSRVIGSTHARILNYPSKVAAAANKLLTFKFLTQNKIPTVDWTEDVAVALQWWKTHSVIGHFNLHGHSGSGLKLFQKGKEEPDVGCKVYTKYFRKTREVRVHCIWNGRTFQSMYLEKKRVKNDRYEEFGLDETPTTYIRTHKNGWIFARDVSTDFAAVKLAADTMGKIGLAFGAVDIMTDGKNYVVGEINTAPGLDGKCLAFYVSYLGNLIRKGEMAS